MATLTPQQIAQFRRDGTLIIEGLVPPAVTEGWRAQFWEAVDADPHDTGTWPGRFEETVLTIHAQASTNQPENPLRPALGHVAEVRDIVAQLGGAHFAEGQRPELSEAEAIEAGVPGLLPEPVDHFLAHWPPEVLQRQAERNGSVNGRSAPLYRRTEDFHLHVAGHIDGGNGNKGGWRGGYMLCAISYLDDLPERGGGTNYWPRSLQPVHRYMLAHPEEYASGGFGNSWGVGAAATNSHATDLSEWGGGGGHGAGGPLEFTGKAGTVLFMHAYTVHSAPVMNAAEGTCRKALFARWHHPEYRRYGAGCGAPPDENLWSGWAATVAETPSDGAAAKL